MRLTYATYETIKPYLFSDELGDFIYSDSPSRIIRCVKIINRNYKVKDTDLIRIIDASKRQNTSN